MAQKEDRRLGSIIGGKWRVDSILGTGSMATVYAVTHRNGVHAALKILHPTLCTDAKVCERFLGEGYLTNAVKHPGIVRVLDDGMTDDGCVFLVMDLLDGKTLELLRQDRGGKIGVEETLDIADALMDALHAVHSAGIIHRDLKPQNVFVCTNGDVKLLDFGVARVLENTSAKNKMSLFGMVLGTPSFMSPEQAIGARDEVDHRADVYSLAATLFTALTGETVHLGPHVQAKLLAAGTVQARSISIVKQDLPAPIANVIDTALRFDKDERWQSVDAFRRALRDARQAAGLGDPAPVSSVAPVPRPKKRKPLQVIDKGPTRTFIGVGGSDTGAFPSPPPAKTTLPYGTGLSAESPAEEAQPDPHEGHSGAAKALPVAIIRSPITIEEEETTLDEEPTNSELDDHSYPAVHTPMPYEDDPLLAQLQSKRSNAGFVFASLALIAAAIGGVAFYAMGEHPSRADEHTTDAASVAAPATLTSAAVPAEPIRAVEKEALTVDASAPHPTHAAITPPPAWRPRTRINNSPPVTNSNPATSFPRSSVSPEPPPASVPASTATPTVSSDPFSTPE